MLEGMGQSARAAARNLAIASTAQKNAALQAVSEQIWEAREAILEANRADVQAAQAGGLSPAMIDRLTLNPKRIEGTLAELRNVIELDDPVGQVIEQKTLPNGLRLRKVRVALGVLAVIYESRPNVTVDAAGLAVKTGNAVILRGGKETLRTNRALVDAIHAGLAGAGYADAVQFIDSPDRALVTELLKLHQYVDMLIPRGGASLHQFCRENSLIPVITGGIGICHLFVDESADLGASIEVVRNAKIQRPTVCNALDTVLVHRSVAAGFLPALAERLLPDGVSLRVDVSALPYLLPTPDGKIQPAGEADFDTEWLSLVLGVKVVDSLDQAIQHIAQHSTAHSDGILTQNDENARIFTALVDSAAVYVNASTRFTDGAQFGLGAEVAISTQRLHARGPMGLPELTSYKWVVEGNYHVRP